MTLVRLILRGMALSVEITSKNFNDGLKAVREEINRAKAVGCSLIQFQFVGKSAATLQQTERWLHLNDYAVIRPGGHGQRLDVFLNQDENAGDKLLQTAPRIPKPKRYDDTRSRHRSKNPMQKIAFTCSCFLLVLVVIGTIAFFASRWNCEFGKYCLVMPRYISYINDSASGDNGN